MSADAHRSLSRGTIKDAVEGHQQAVVAWNLSHEVSNRCNLAKGDARSLKGSESVRRRSSIN